MAKKLVYARSIPLGRRLATSASSSAKNIPGKSATGKIFVGKAEVTDGLVEARVGAWLEDFSTQIDAVIFEDSLSWAGFGAVLGLRWIGDDF